MMAAAWSAGCEGRPRVAEVRPEPAGEPEREITRVIWPDEGPNLTKPLPASPRIDRAWSTARKTRPCHAYLEGLGGAPVSRFPLDDARERAEVLFGCEVEAHEVLSDGARALTYALPVSGAGLLESPSMRLAVYGADGALEWSHVAKREVRGVSFASSFREGFVADLTPHLVCGGTSWESGVQALCARRDGGEEVWSARLPTWSGLRPSASGKSLMVTDLLGVKLLYPYTGAERRHVKFGGSGGRSAVYAQSEAAILFGANRGTPYTLTSYGRQTLEPLWTVQIDDALETDYGVSTAQTWVFKSRGRLVGLSAQDGAARWAARIGEDRAPLAASPDAIYVLMRREKGPNRIFELDPETGAARGWTPAPDGTLRIGWSDGFLLAGSVRTVWSAPGGSE
jgi:hypothetical protein